MTEGLVLASASTVRARLLAAAGVDFRIEPADLDEGSFKQACRAEGRDAAGCALALAEAKARRVAARCDRALVIGADQLLVCREVWFDKPVDLGQARTQLQALRGRTHELVTAGCAVQDGSRLWHSVSRPRLTMRHFTDDFLDDYILAGGADILGSVGAYRLEDRGVQLFERIEGDYFAILGLPLLELLGFLRAKGMIPS
ncbi:MAG TPA: Maf family protein [Stellaceae bacterium]|nr:Maf family protein [Stellaceae bacterium]